MTSSSDRWALVLLLSLAILPLKAQAGGNSSGGYDVRSFGAKGDGAALDSPAINARHRGGGREGRRHGAPARGDLSSRSIRLRSNIVLYLDQARRSWPPRDRGAVYDAPEPNPDGAQFQDFGHSHWHNSLIWGEGLENVSILGPGRSTARAW